MIFPSAAMEKMSPGVPVLRLNFNAPPLSWMVKFTGIVIVPTAM